MNLAQAYSQEHCLSFLNGFLPEYSKDIRDVHFSSSNFLYVKSLGTSPLLDLHVLEIEVRGALGRRVTITNDAFKVLKSIAAYRALVVFHSKNTEDWRFSLMTAKPTIEDGKVITKLSNPRRYSYLLGPSAKIVTPYKYLIKAGKIADFDDLQKRFSAEVVNSEFYKEIAKLYDSLVGMADIKPALKYPGSGEASHQFAVRLIGRIVFCWFLREKYSPNNIPLISKTILSLEAAKERNYYHSVLAPLFFEVLNKLKDKRSRRFMEGDFGKIPYLNGGLFSPQNDDYYKFDPVLELSVPGVVDVPDSWINKLFELLETYHFTVDENTSVDIELSIDPEMLGRIFENLLARINPETGETVRKSTGSFYTPREIVEYMVDESLVRYLIDKTSVEEAKLRVLVSYDIDDDKDQPLNEAEKQQIVMVLNKVKILDPACGSGAFPIGILQKIVFMLQQADPEAKLWFDNQIANMPPEVRHLIEREFRHKNFDYIRKLGVIRESIFGVDIQPIATEIARLRCFLTLIVDERVDDSEKNRGVEPLPNLDFKFITANTLIHPPRANEESMQLFDSFEEQLERIVDEYFSADGVKKLELVHSLRDLIDRKVDENISYVLNNKGLVLDKRFQDAFNAKNADVNAKLIKEANIWKSYKNLFTHQPVQFFETKYFFPSAKDGFDIVIGNPPYIQLQRNSGELAELYKGEGYETFARTGDIYSLFYERGLKLVKSITGILCFITSNKWMRAAYGEKTRIFFLKYNPLTLIDFGDLKIFESATVGTNIMLIQNVCNNQGLQAAHFKGDYEKDQNIKYYFDSHSIVLSNLTEGTWVISDLAGQGLKEKIEKIGEPLKNWSLSINYGLKTGYNEAFIIDEVTKARLIAEDPKSTDVIKPILRGRDISRYTYSFMNQYLLFIPWHFPLQLDSSISGASHKAEQTFRERYPAVYSYLLRHKNKLSNRNKAETGIRYEWYALQRWGADYYQEFEKEKISWGNLTLNAQFALVEPGYYISAPSPFLVSDNNHYMLGVLNSKVGDYYIRQLGVTRNGGYFEYKPMFIDKLPVPKIHDDNKKLVMDIESYVKQILEVRKSNPNADTHKIEDSIDELVYELYGLSEEEIKTVEESIKRSN